MGYNMTCDKHPDYRGGTPPGKCERCKTIALLAAQDTEQVAGQVTGEVTGHGARGHHTESASSLQPKEWCPYYTGRDTTSEAAEMGTKLHEHAEKGSTEGLGDEEAALVQLCLDHVQECCKEMESRWGNVKQHQEVYGNVDQIEWPCMGEKSTSGGFVDVVLESETPEGPVIHVLDYKFGQWPVEEAGNNLQGIVYLLNYRQKHPTLRQATVSFLMPKLGQISTHTFERGDFPALYTRIKRLVSLRSKIREGKRPAGARENPCYHTCMWCGRLAECQTLSREVARPAAKFQPFSVPADLDIQKISEKSDISSWVKFADVLKAYAGAVRDRCTNLVVMNPDLEPDTHTLVTQAERRVTDYARLEAVLLEEGVPEDVIASLRKIGITEAKKAVGALAPKGAKTLAEKNFDEALVAQGVLVPDGEKIYLRAKKEKLED